DFTGDGTSDFILQSQNVAHIAVIILGPLTCAVFGANETCCDTHAIHLSPDATSQDIFRTEFASDFANVFRRSLVMHRRSTTNHTQAAGLQGAELGDQFVAES